MPKRRRTCFWLFLAALAASHAPASAQQAGRVSHVLARHWSDVPGDTAALAELLQASWETGGATVMRGVLAAAADPQRPYEVRLHALSGIAEFMLSNAGPGLLKPLRAAGERGASECRPSTTWAPGDTIRSCALSYIFPERSFYPRYYASTSIEPILRDTLRAAVQAITAADPDPRVRGAAAVLWRIIGDTERWNPSRAERCRALASGTGGPAVSAVDPFSGYASCEQTGPVLLAGAWRALGAADSTRRIFLMRESQRVRDRRLQAALQDVATDTARGVPVRRAALTALATLADGRMQVFDLRPSAGESCQSARYTEQDEGGEPMGRSGRPEVLEFMRELAGDGATADPVADEAARLAACLSDFSAPAWPRP